MQHVRAYGAFAIKAAISLALLYIAARFLNFDALRERFDHLNIVWAAAALLGLVVQVVLVALRWRRIAAFCGGSMTRWSATRYTLIGTFFNQVLPSTVGGDAARIWLLARDTGAWKSAVYSVLIDRALGLIWLALLVLVCLPWSLSLIQNPVGRMTLAVIGIGGVASPFGLLLFSRLGGGAATRWKPLRHLVELAGLAWRALVDAKTGAPVGLISVVVQLITVIVVWFCARAIGSPLTVIDATLLIPPIILIASIPLSIAGWGVRESAMLAAFGYAGLPQSDGVIVSILFGAANLVVGVLGGITWVVSASSLRFAALQEASEHALDT